MEIATESAHIYRTSIDRVWKKVNRRKLHPALTHVKIHCCKILIWLQVLTRYFSLLLFQAQGGERREHLYKILVIGELGTGKTSIIKRYVHQFFSQHYRATIGVDFALKVLTWDQNTIIRLQLWDIAGKCTICFNLQSLLFSGITLITFSIDVTT